MEFNNNQKSLLYTLIYSDIFNFPLTGEEIWQGLISDRKIERSSVSQTLKNLCDKKIISFIDGFYCLAGKEEIIKKRLQRVNSAHKKLKIAKAVAEFLSYIPTVYFIGLTGRLSHFDADDDDDIDMIFITKKNTVWSTRLIILFALEFLNVRRTRIDKKASDKICPNLILDVTALSWAHKKRDLYTAHEITHVYPLFDRNNYYQIFLNKNSWIKRFYPNHFPNNNKKLEVKNTKHYYVLNYISNILTLHPVEYILDNLQRLYMSGKVTNETIKRNLLAFHPHDYRPEILRAYSNKIKELII